MKWETNHDPNKDGDYIVLKGYLSPEVSTMDFTVEGGWNSFRTYFDGILMGDNAFDDHVGEKGSWIRGWLTLSDGDPWRDGRPTEDGYYIVAMPDKNTIITFSVKNGWNALYKAENQIEDEYILGWMPIETVKEAFS